MNHFQIEGSAQARVVADSCISSSRLASIEVEFPRPYLAEFNTHCVFARNSASSRAIPVWKRLIAVLDRPYVPNTFGANKAGMQSASVLSDTDQELARENWLFGRDMSVIQAFNLAGGEREVLSESKGKAEVLCQQVQSLISNYGLPGSITALGQGMHKQHANRVLEAYAFHTVLVTTTDLRNFFALRCSHMAQPEAQDFGIAMAKALRASTPVHLDKGQWHLPYIRDDDRSEISDMKTLADISAGRSARVSYLTQDGVRSLDDDIKLSARVLSGGHMSPFEHQARPSEEDDPDWVNGKFQKGWAQYRKLIPNEHDFSKLISRDSLITGCREDEALADFILSLQH
jgi:hypothetical protein